MALSIRLARGGRKKRPFYRIVVADKRMPRDGRYIERLGTYNPLLANDDEQRIVLNQERVKYWLGEGAKPSTRVQIFLAGAGMMDMPERRDTPKKSAPSEKTQERIREKEEKAKAAAEAAKEAAESAKEAPEEPKAEEPKAEEPKAEEPKAEEKSEEKKEG